jgi:hypothetical protein
MNETKKVKGRNILKRKSFGVIKLQTRYERSSILISSTLWLKVNTKRTILARRITIKGVFFRLYGNCDMEKTTNEQAKANISCKKPFPLLKTSTTLTIAAIINTIMLVIF